MPGYTICMSLYKNGTNTNSRQEVKICTKYLECFLKTIRYAFVISASTAKRTFVNTFTLITTEIVPPSRPAPYPNLKLPNNLWTHW